MIMLIALLLLGAAAQLPLGATAPLPADFSGRWTLDAPAVATTPAVPGTPAAAAAPGDMGSGWGSTITITQDAKQLKLEYAFFSRYDAQPSLTFVYPLDGSEGRNVVTMGRGEQIELSRVRWEGPTLTISTTSQIADPRLSKPFTSALTRKLWLESPTTMIVEVTRAGVLGGPSLTTRSVYRKG